MHAFHMVCTIGLLCSKRGPFAKQKRPSSMCTFHVVCLNVKRDPHGRERDLPVTFERSHLHRCEVKETYYIVKEADCVVKEAYCVREVAGGAFS